LEFDFQIAEGFSWKLANQLRARSAYHRLRLVEREARRCRGFSARTGALASCAACGHDDSTLSRDYLGAARRVLQELVATPGLVERLPLERKPGCYARNLLAGDDEVSVWAIVWSPGADHLDPRPPLLLLLRRGQRHGHRDLVSRHRQRQCRADRGSRIGRRAMSPACCRQVPTSTACSNLGLVEAISIHIYGFDHEVHASSIETEYTVSNG
jgi:predicted metal-dependent enzyme (double-stranded beta helix superfamily)